MTEEPEHRLIALCREIMKEDGPVASVSFRVDRECGECQTYSIGRKDETDQSPCD